MLLGIEKHPLLFSYGTAMLDVKEEDQSIVLDGSYFTGRNTSGQMNFKLKEIGAKNENR